MPKQQAPPPETPTDPETQAEPLALATAPFRVDAPGIYEMTEAQYHADPCPLPSLSRSILRTMVTRSPQHAWIAHPRLGGLGSVDFGSDDDVQDFGTAAHSSFLKGTDIIRQMGFADWRTNAAKEARRNAYAAGLIPLLAKSYDRAMRLLDVLENFRAVTGAFTAGKPEQTAIWQEDATWCRARIDWLPDDPAAPCWDLKTTGGAATPAAWGRVAFDKGADLQDSFYNRGVETLRGEPPAAMLFCVVEQLPPHGLAVFEFDRIARGSADGEVAAGLALWSASMETGHWPGYSLQPNVVFPPSWVVRAREDRMRPDLEREAIQVEHRAGVAFGNRLIEAGTLAG